MNTASGKQIFQKIDPKLPEDPSIIEAGTDGELLYIRGLLFSRLTLSEGRLTKFNLPTFAHGIPNPKKHAAHLVQLGLWIDAGDEWQIRNWVKWNMTRDDRLERSRQRADSGRRGAHSKWHTVEKPGANCQYCEAEGWC